MRGLATYLMDRTSACPHFEETSAQLSKTQSLRRGNIVRKVVWLLTPGCCVGCQPASPRPDFAQTSSYYYDFFEPTCQLRLKDQGIPENLFTSSDRPAFPKLGYTAQNDAPSNTRRSAAMTNSPLHTSRTFQDADSERLGTPAESSNARDYQSQPTLENPCTPKKHGKLLTRYTA
jgi:hypothetical protein